MLIVMLIASTSCIYRGSPIVNLIIENQTDQVLTIIFDGGLVGNVGASDKVVQQIDVGMSEYAIEAKNVQGETVFYQSYIFEDFQEVDEDVFKVIIPPLQNHSTPNVSLDWNELQGKFITKNLDRAQSVIPFTIILPTYLPEELTEELPDIKGPLLDYRKSNEIEVHIYYLFPVDTGLPGIIIEERNHHLALADSEIVQIEINGTEVYKTTGDFVLGPGVWFNFNYNNIYYLVEIYNLTYEESVKIVESMINQLK